MYVYNATVSKVHDGDTIRVDVDLGFGVWWKDVDLRLMGLNAPELNTPAGKDSLAYLLTLIPVGTEVVIHTEKDKQEKYGRYLATVLVDDHGVMASVNMQLIKNGHAQPWDGHGVRPV